MIIGVSVISCCLLFSLMFLVLYFSKGRINNMENKVYSFLIVINIIDLIMELLCCYFTYYNQTSVFNTFMCNLCNRLFIICLLTWLSIFTFYIFYITFTKKEKIKRNIKVYQKKFIHIAGTIYIILLILALILPLYYHNEQSVVYSYGPATQLLVVFGGISIMFDIYCVYINRKNIKDRQYYPLFILIVLITGALIVRNINPGIILINSTFAFITSLMFHTIENPDMQMIGELYKNKKIIEKSNEDTSRFLFRVTADLKTPVKEIINTSNDIKTLKTKEEIIEANKYINEYANNLDYLLNKVLNISDMDTQKIKIYDSKYNVYNLFEEISRHTKEEIGNKLEFKQTIGASIPTYLYGDSIKLKQVIFSTIKLSKEATDEGFISLDVSSIIKYNICRLIITIEDSGKGISIDRVNEILSMNGEDIHINEEKKNLNILEIKKLINILGGSLMIKSDEGKGTTVVITLDQKIVATKETELTKRLENYEQTLHNNKKVLLIDDDEEELDKTAKLLEKETFEITTSLIGRDAIEKIRNKNKYDLIILDDELTDITALTILKELKKLNNFKTPVVVMINDNKETIKLEYLKDGFADTISKSKLETEIERIIKRFE